MKQCNGVVLFLIHVFHFAASEEWTESVVVIAGGHELNGAIPLLTDRMCFGIPLF